MEMTPPSPKRVLQATPLDDDATREVFRRLPLNDPRSLVYAAAGCSSWRGILSDDVFICDHRKTHGAPPLLGFLYEEFDDMDEDDDETHWVSHFVSTSTFRPRASQDRPYWQLVDSRHGLVLFYTPRIDTEFVVCDLVTGSEWSINADPKFSDILRWEWEEEEEKLERLRCTATVLCAKDGCDHLDCHGGPFRVALVGSLDARLVARATIYSSLTGEWSEVVEIQILDHIDGTGLARTVVLGNNVYAPSVHSDNVVEFNIDEQTLSLIVAPDRNHGDYISLMGVEDGMLLFASVEDYGLNLWSMELGPNGAARWARQRTIELEPLIPAVVLQQDVSAVGYAQAVSVIFIGTEHGLYTIDLKTGDSEKVHAMRRIVKVLPYMSFYSGAWWLSATHIASGAVAGATTM